MLGCDCLGDKEFKLRLELACFNRVGELKKELNCSLLLWQEYILDVSRHCFFFFSDKTTYTTSYSHIVFCKESNLKDKYNDLRAGKGRYGIYFFYRKVNNSLIVNHIVISAKKPHLNKRMAQHFSSIDTGGLPYKLAVRDVARIDDALMSDGLTNLLINQ